jgi:hypothetical protein
MTGGQAGSVGAAGGPPAAAQVGVLTLDFTTVNQRGRYAPQNVGAVWIETDAGMFVKTLERWGQIRANHLTRWNMPAPQDISAPDKPPYSGLKLTYQP